MKQKTGKCGICADSKEKPIIGKFYFDKDGAATSDKMEAVTLESFGMCHSHYWSHSGKKSKNSNKAKIKSDIKKDLNVFFASQILDIPRNCENCKCDITYYRSNSKYNRMLIAHILPKRERYGFPTVATHPQNKVFLCPDCHSNYDNLGSDFALKMQCLPLMKERFILFKDLLTEKDLQRVPEYLK